MLTETINLYPERPDVTLTTYVLSDSTEMLNGKKRPGVLICPGGAYLNCSDREAEPVAIRFAAMGYHAFVLRYSTYSNNQPGFFPVSSDLKVNPRSLYPAPLRDIAKAFLYLREHADDFLLDPERMAICGFSAGGHNCALYSVYWDKPVITDYFKKDKELFRPAAAILGYPIGDYHLLAKAGSDPFAKLLFEASCMAYLGTKTPDEKMLDEVSPALHVTKQTPPLFIWATFEDSLVPVENATRLASACAASDVPFEIHVFESGPHGLSLADQSTASSRMEINEAAAQWVILTETWLKKRFALPLPEKPFWMQQLEHS